MLWGALLVLLVAIPLSYAQESTFTGLTIPPGPAFNVAPQFGGSLPRGPQVAADELLPLSMQQAIQLGLANNLGLLLSREGIESARGQRWVELSRLLPNLTTSASVHRLKESLAITGISVPGVPSVVGPFNYYDGRIFLTQRIFDLEAIERTRAAGHEVAAASYSEKDARELVVVAVGAAYLQALTAEARVQTVGAQLVTASTILDRAVELHKAGVTPGIDELRARVEVLARTQQLIVAENDLAKQKLTLNRMIGLPVGEEVTLTDQAPFEPVLVLPAPELITRALASRDDYQAAERLVKAAESTHAAALAQRLPALVLDADYGSTGLTLSTMKETYHIVGSLKLPIFEGGRIHGEVLRAEAQVKQRRDELEDLRERIEYEVRTAILDMQAAARQVQLATKSTELAETTLAQAQERFAAGIDNNLAVVQAQQSVAAAHEAELSSLYQHNLAKLLLARAVGGSDAAVFGGK
ncbi:TolC family protein [Geomonas sp. Red32]|uniref:TolC family protein n=1 Tax=Geomonas sp. Red32 TaxID=2912856 RepID=UPI00202CB5B1|nr:TolC family protein [Geomonas sp. Red32]MCM0080888.1 TolC family protein [Geomonas sp. Red32]